jgi:hypothetical protein
LLGERKKKKKEGEMARGLFPWGWKCLASCVTWDFRSC